jgi:hypothetical protein
MSQGTRKTSSPIVIPVTADAAGKFWVPTGAAARVIPVGAVTWPLLGSVDDAGTAFNFVDTGLHPLPQDASTGVRLYGLTPGAQFTVLLAPDDEVADQIKAGSSINMLGVGSFAAAIGTKPPRQVLGGSNTPQTLTGGINATGILSVVNFDQVAVGYSTGAAVGGSSPGIEWALEFADSFGNVNSLTGAALGNGGLGANAQIDFFGSGMTSAFPYYPADGVRVAFGPTGSPTSIVLKSWEVNAR